MFRFPRHRSSTLRPDDCRVNSTAFHWEVSRSAGSIPYELVGHLPVGTPIVQLGPFAQFVIVMQRWNEAVLWCTRKFQCCWRHALVVTQHTIDLYVHQFSNVCSVAICWLANKGTGLSLCGRHDRKRSIWVQVVMHWIVDRHVLPRAATCKNNWKT